MRTLEEMRGMAAVDGMVDCEELAILLRALEIATEDNLLDPRWTEDREKHEECQRRMAGYIELAQEQEEPMNKEGINHAAGELVRQHGGVEKVREVLEAAKEWAALWNNSKPGWAEACVRLFSAVAALRKGGE